MKKFNFDKKYLYWGITALCVIGIALLGHHLLNKWSNVEYYIEMTFKALRPIMIGLIIAYILNPLLNIFEKYIFSKIFKIILKNNPKIAKSLSRGCSIFFTLATAIALVSWLLFLILPELYVNIEGIVKDMPAYIEKWIAQLTELSKQYPEITTPVLNYFKDISQDLMDWAKGKMLPGANTVITNLYSGIYTTFKIILDVVLGIIVCVYVLAAKEKYGAGIRKILYAFMKKNNAEKLLKLTRYTHKHFGGFLVGKIVDSAIIGVLSFIVFTIFDIPYTTLVSVIVGVTNVIPFFGPFIGAIPCALLILLVDPIKAIVFSILIFAIQQLDGNIIGPKILGESTGIDSFGVVFAILLAGGLFGVPGMILGVPVFATIFGIVVDVCNKSLKEKKLPTDIEAYQEIEVVESEEE